MQPKYQEKIIDLQTGEIHFRDYTEEEIAAVEKAKAEAAVLMAELAEKEAARKAIFDKLGLTEEEAAVLLS